MGSHISSTMQADTEMKQLSKGFSFREVFETLATHVMEIEDISKLILTSVKSLVKHVISVNNSNAAKSKKCINCSYSSE